jgi:hypothetical protein
MDLDRIRLTCVQSTDQDMTPATNAIGVHAHYFAVQEEWIDIIHSLSVPVVRSLATDSCKFLIFSVCVQLQEETVAPTNTSQVALPIASSHPRSARNTPSCFP